MGFLGIYRALYNYTPQGEGELAISEGDVLYVLEKSGEDDWWRAKKKASGDDDDEPVGLVPNNYVEEVRSAAAHQLQHISTRRLRKMLRLLQILSGNEWFRTVSTCFSICEAITNVVQ